MPDSLRSLSDHELLSRTRELIDRERKLTLSVLLHLNEIERRRLHLKRGHSTMFDYCTAGLGYSASAAMRRIQAARCIARFPDVYDLLVANRVNLSTVCMAAKVLTQDNKADVLARICGKSQREVEAIVAEIEPLSKLPRDRVRTVVVRVPAAAAVVANCRNGRSTDVKMDSLFTAPGRSTVADQPAHTDEYYRNGDKTETPKVRRRAMIQFSASEEFMAKVERVRALASHRLRGNASLEEVFELALDCFIAKEAPEAREKRRESRKSVRKEKQWASHSLRAIPTPTRDAVFVRDQGRCTYVGANGKRCESQHALQIDHVQPVARGGPGTPENLRLLCAQHNRLESERLMGRSGPRDGLFG